MAGKRSGSSSNRREDAAHERLKDQLYGPRPSIDKREPFMNLEGSVRLRALKNAYGKGDTVFRLFGPQAEKLLKRHLHNPRKMKVNVRKFARGILKYGLMPCMRSKLQGTVSSDHPDIAGAGDMWAGGTVVESCYEAHRMDAANEHVQLLLEEGIEGELWDKDMPQDVILWLRDEANEHTESAGMTFLDRRNESLVY